MSFFKAVQKKRDNPVPAPLPLRSNCSKQNKFPRKNSAVSLSFFVSKYAVLAQRSPISATVFKIQLLFGNRISEILALKNEDVSPLGLLRITSSKKGNTRILYFPEILPLVSFDERYLKHQIFRITYSQYYRHLKRVGIYANLRGKERNKTVTHLARKYTFESLRQAWQLPPEEIALFSGHKSLNGLSYYLGSNSFQHTLENQSY